MFMTSSHSLNAESARCQISNAFKLFIFNTKQDLLQSFKESNGIADVKEETAINEQRIEKCKMIQRTTSCY